MRIREKNISKVCRNTLLIMICVLAGVLFADIHVRAETIRTGTVYGINIGSSLNFRNAPVNGASVKKLYNGDSGTILAEQTGSDGYVWYQMNVDGTIGWARSDFISVTTTDTSMNEDFESYLNTQGFPESYKAKLRTLHAKYPNWVFEAQHVGLTWNEVIAAESSDHRNLVHTDNISSWKSLEGNDYNWSTGVWKGYDTSSWVAASKGIVQYYMDPRNLLDDSSVFQFLKQSYDRNMDYTSSLTSMVKDTFLSGSFTENGATKSYVSALIEAAALSGVSPYTIATIIIQEQGSEGKGGCISGTEPGYQGYYNFFNIEAYQYGTLSPIQKGLSYAKQTDASTFRPWNTRTKSIAGGASIYGKKYVNVGQDTIYLKKFDVVSTGGLYNHQYMTNIQGATSEGQILSSAYDAQARKSRLVFKIPVYENMPSVACARPTDSGKPYQLLQSLSVSGGSITPAFNMYQKTYTLNVPGGPCSVTVSASANNPNAVISGTGNVAIDSSTGAIYVTVTIPNVITNKYTLTIGSGGYTGHWVLDANGWWYQNVDGTYPYSTWKIIDGEWYYFNASGYMVTGWLKQGNTWYYLEESGAMATGFLKVGSAKYYFDESGAMKTDWQKINGEWYYFDTSGAMKTGWQQIKGVKYYFKETGAMATGWTQIEDAKYYFDANGNMATGWTQIGNTKHYFNEDGTVATGWTQIGDKKYFLNEYGAIQTGWVQLEDTWYYIKSDGNIVIGWLQQGSTWYYFDKDGKMATGWQKVGDTKYYFNASGAMATGWLKLDKTWYYFHGSGAMATGWLYLGSTWYYFDKDGAMATGWLLSGNTWYYFHGSGAMATGWLLSGNTWYYFHGSGAMATGWQIIGGKWYYFHGTGAMAANQWIGNYYLQADGSMATSRWIGPYYVNASGLWVPGRR